MLREGESPTESTLAGALARYRRTGADPPGFDPARDHGTRFEGYYWRFTDHQRGTAVIVLCGLCRLGGRRWAVVALAVHPAGEVRTAIVEQAAGNPGRFGVTAGDVLSASERKLSLRIGPDAALEAELHVARPWSRRWLGGSGFGQLVPGLQQYWHPCVLGGVVTGEASVNGERIPLDGAHVYVEKNWGHGFPERWWWGQADAFEQADACVAFAGGPTRLAGLSLSPTLLVVRLGDRLLRLAPPFARSVAEVDRGSWRLRAWSPSHSVELEGEDAGSSVTLPVPEPNQVAVKPRARQALAGRLHVVVRSRNRTLLRAETSLAGLEHPRD